MISKAFKIEIKDEKERINYQQIYDDNRKAHFMHFLFMVVLFYSLNDTTVKPRMSA